MEQLHEARYQKVICLSWLGHKLIIVVTWICFSPRLPWKSWDLSHNRWNQHILFGHFPIIYVTQTRKNDLPRLDSRGEDISRWQGTEHGEGERSGVWIQSAFDEKTFGLAWMLRHLCLGWVDVVDACNPSQNVLVISLFLLLCGKI